MTPFLKQVAEHYYRLGSIEERLFIFPNRRSMTFFKKHLSDCVRADRRVMPAPQMTTINDFFSKTAQMRTTDRISLLLKLYESYGRLNPKAEPLDGFIYWGDVLLSDFDDVDKYLVDARNLFANVTDLKAMQDDLAYATEEQKAAIERLSGHLKDRSGGRGIDASKDFFLIWQMLLPLYDDFRKRLAAEGAAYEGMVYRKVAEEMKERPAVEMLDAAFPQVRSFVFVGLNALNECEKAVMKKMDDAGIAEFAWDYSGPFMTDKANGCSHFMGDNVSRFSHNFIPQEDGGVPRIHVCEIPSATGQAKMLQQLVKPQEVRDAMDFAVVLADESMLMPVLNGLPDCPQGVNVTMGYPLGSSEWAALMKDVVAMQLHIRYKGGKAYFYHKQVHDILSGGIVRSVLDEEEAARAEAIVQGAKFYVPQEDFGDGPVLPLIFSPAVAGGLVNDPSQEEVLIGQNDALAGYLLGVTERIAASLPEEESLQAGFAKEYWCSVNRLKPLRIGVLAKSWAHLLDQVVAGVSVPFEGEPLRGLQVMGPLETRAVDFRNIVILNANEGTFPRTSISSSFIPPEIRKAFGLPTYEHQDKVWAYYFYRLISRAENVWMLYDSRTEGSQTGEESRYVKQLWFRYRDKVEMDRIIAAPPLRGHIMDEVIPKTGEDVEKIRNMEFSASSLNKYLTCPAQFYYHSVKGLKEPDEVQENMDKGLMGTVCHDTLKALYEGEEAMKAAPDEDGKRGKGWRGDRLITRAYLEGWLAREDEIREKVLSLIRIKLRSIDVEGRDLVSADVIVRFITRVLKEDLKLMKDNGADSFHLHGLEVESRIEICGHRFKGYLDRVDSFTPDSIRVVDYKTGSDDPRILGEKTTAANIFNRSTHHKYKAALQFYIYDRMLEADGMAAGRTVQNSMYAMGDIFRNGVAVYRQDETLKAGVEERLNALFSEMEDTATPFKRVNDNNTCKNCDYCILCGRTSKD